MSQRKVVPTEHQIQSAFFDWVRWNRGRYTALNLCFAVPNAAKRGPWLAAWLRAEGLTAGVPDVLLLVPCGNYSGLAVEFKRPGRKLTAEQARMIAVMREYGWLVHVLNSTEDAIRYTKEYLSLEV